MKTFGQIFFWVIFLLLHSYRDYLNYIFTYFRKLLRFGKFWQRSKFDLKDFVNLKQIPAHLGISVGLVTPLNGVDNQNGNIFKQLEKVAEIIYWASLLNIKYLSVYDSEGILKSHSQLLRQQMATKFQTCSLENGNHITCVKHGGKIPTNSTEDKLYVFIPCREDGKIALLQAIQESYITKQLETPPGTQINEQLLDHYLNKIMYLKFWDDINKSDQIFKPDPDLLMIIGDTKSLLGFLPWHIRNTEIHFLPSMSDIEHADFAASIKKFANCEQRFGK